MRDVQTEEWTSLHLGWECCTATERIVRADLVSTIILHVLLSVE